MFPETVDGALALEPHKGHRAVEPEQSSVLTSRQQNCYGESQATWGRGEVLLCTHLK